MWLISCRLTEADIGTSTVFVDEESGNHWLAVHLLAPAGGRARQASIQEKAATPPPALTDTNVVPMPSMGKSSEHDPLSVRRKSNK
jgi:hypothetical protein